MTIAAQIRRSFTSRRLDGRPVTAVDAGMAETKPGTPPGRARIGNTGEEGRRQPAPCLGHHPRGERLPVGHLDTLSGMLVANYRSGDDFVVEFLGHRFEFNAVDFEERVSAAAVKLGLVGSNDLDDDEAADLVELVADGRIVDPRSGLGLYLVRHWERVSLVKGESLVYWLRKLVFRSAWLDHRVKEGLLDVSWLEDTGDFGYAEPAGGRALLELAPTPSWHDHRYRG
jgi:hypothetical protein